MRASRPGRRSDTGRRRSCPLISCAAVVGSGEHDLDASLDAFSLLDQIVAARAGRRLTTVVDTLGLDPERRLAWLALARQSGLPAVAVLFETDAWPSVPCARNRARERPVPAAVLDAQLRRLPDVAAQLEAEGWDLGPAAPSAGLDGQARC